MNLRHDFTHAGASSRLCSTFSVAERSPMIRLIGCGSFLISVGIATIWSSLASSGLRIRSMTSILQPWGTCLSQMRRRLAIAASDRVDCPATYKHIVQGSFACAPFCFKADVFLERDSTEFFGERFFFFTDQSHLS